MIDEIFYTKSDKVYKLIDKIKRIWIPVTKIYTIITNEHSDKIYKVDADDIRDIVDNFANRLLRRI